MRAYFLLLLAVVTVLATSNTVSGSVTKLRSPQNRIDSADGARQLQANVKTDENIDPDDEERGAMGALANAAKKLGTWLNGKYLSLYVRWKSGGINIDETVDAFMNKKSLNPDIVHKVFKLHIPEGISPEFVLWDRYYQKYKAVNPRWKSIYTRTPFSPQLTAKYERAVSYFMRWMNTIMLLLLLALLLATSTFVVSAESTLSKEELCAMDVEYSRNVINLVQVTPEPVPRRNDSSPGMYPRILCFAVSYSAQHQTRVRAVAETWGQRCDKLLFFSNMSDTIVVAANTPAERRFEVVQLDIIADHAHLWLRTRAALKYLHSHFRRDYDWFYKCDDDTYVIMENMKAYLNRPEILQRFKREPMQMGHRLNMPKNTINWYVKNETLRSLYHSRFDRLVYNSGGAGYAMNRLYLDKIVESLPEWTCLPDEASGIMPEDAGVSFCMMWNDVYPWDTRDHRGRERWHALDIANLYRSWDGYEDNWYVRYHKTVGGVRSFSESTAPDSVAFHYVKPPQMYHLERSLYWCRTEHDRIEAFNKEFGLATGEKVMVA